MDIKEKIEELVKQIGADEDLKENFMKDPIGTLETKLGVDLPNEQIEKVVDGIRAKLAADKIGDALGSLGGLFGKK